jgi:hypothetical protein
MEQTLADVIEKLVYAVTGRSEMPVFIKRCLGRVGVPAKRGGGREARRLRLRREGLR